jgi:steroid 5-alpha reductase family enzyme
MDPAATWLAALVGGAAWALGWALVWSVPAILLRRNDIADVAWGLTFPFLALMLGGAVVALDWASEPRATLVLVLVSAWALRLAWHIGRRWVAHDEEDRRYARWREQWGDRWIVRSVLQVFVLQALIALVVAQPVVIAVVVHEGESALGVLDAIATVLVVGGLWLESTADRQLRRFLRRRASGEEQRRYLTTGVWSWSRHPNYAGDAITWWGFGAFGIAGALDAGAPWLCVPAIVGPLVMTAFLRYGSGVPMSERGRAGHPEWDAYVERTSAFLPRPPRRTRS